MDLQSYNDLRRLLRAAINYQGRQRLTGYVSSQTEAPSWDLFLLTMPDLRKKYWLALGALHNELVPNYMSAQDVYISLWNLFKEATLNGSHYQNKANLDSKLAEFCQEVKKPLLTFDVIYEIKNLDIGETRFSLSNVELLKVTTEYLKSLGFKAGVSLIKDSIFEEWVGRSIAKLEVNVSGIDRAYESGSTRVNSVLDVIKLAAVTEKLSKLFDEMFLWELGESIVIPRVKPKNGTLLSISSHLGFRPLIVPMDNSIQKGFENWDTWKYVLDSNLPEDINVRVMRAIKWISHAISSSSLDYKLVDLCTALEILLLPNHKIGTKGELISLRQVLVGRGISYAPEGILYLYNKRSNIVHGGFLETTSYSDYWNLLMCCLEVLRKIVNLSKQHPNITTLGDLIGVVETPESLRDFVKHCEWGMYKGQGIKDIKTTAEQRIAEIEPSK